MMIVHRWRKDADVSCAACRSLDVQYRFCRRHHQGGETWGPHLHLTCVRCGYGWLMNAAPESRRRWTREAIDREMTAVMLARRRDKAKTIRRLRRVK